MGSKLFTLVLILLSVLLLPLMGCATIMTGKYQTIPVTSEPLGATVRTDTGETVIAPGKFNLMRNEEHTLVAEYPGCKPQQLILHNKAQGWIWGNILAGGIIGYAIDKSSGASDELVPKKVHFNFANPQLTTREAVKAKKKDKVAAEKPEPEPERTEKVVKKDKADVIDNNSAAINERTISKDSAVITVISCANCGEKIGRLEEPALFESDIVCAACYKRLIKSN